MAKETIRVEITLESNLKHVELIEVIAQTVAKQCGFGEDGLHEILMAVHECAINAICHGNKEDLQKQVGLSLSVHPDRLEIRVRDQGKSFNPNDVPDPLDKENLMKPAGRGILLIQAFMDEFRVERCENWGNEVIMTKRLPSPSQPEKGGVGREHQ